MNETENTRLDTDVAWCAGFFDGEGHVSYRRSYVSKNKTVSPTLHANIAQVSKNKEVLEFFHSIVGMGRVNGPYKMPAGNDQHRLIFGTKEIMPLLQILKPYLRSEKTLDFQLALAAYWAHDPTPTPEDYERTRKWQKKRGCPKCKAEWNGMVCFACGYL